MPSALARGDNPPAQPAPAPYRHPCHCASLNLQRPTAQKTARYATCHLVRPVSTRGAPQSSAQQYLPIRAHRIRSGRSSGGPEFELSNVSSSQHPRPATTVPLNDSHGCACLAAMGAGAVQRGRLRRSAGPRTSRPHSHSLRQVHLPAGRTQRVRRGAGAGEQSNAIDDARHAWWAIRPRRPRPPPRPPAAPSSTRTCCASTPRRRSGCKC